ncbi:MAG: dihydroorotate dehydrogenase [Bacteroidales bacterium]|nr:MAG: dihydroorotate dehydrogenase [Bacteroidales bacterium]
MADLTVNIGQMQWKNPVGTASGCFGYGPEFDDFIDVNRLGAVFVKGTTGSKREGNPYPRMVETASGMLNSVGLQNKGIDYFISDIYPVIRKYNTHMIVNVSGSTVEEYVEVSEKLNDLDGIPAIELNISCPNVKDGGMVFGIHCPSAIKVTDAVRKVYHKTLIVKLSPNVTSIPEFARGVEGAGADAVSLINTLLGMAIDAGIRKPVLATVTGGLSGPAVKPVALRMVWEAFRAVKIPVIGMGGIMNATDAVEFMLAGATAIQVGTANFIDPQVSLKILEGIGEYLENHNIPAVKNLTGALELPDDYERYRPDTL